MGTFRKRFLLGHTTQLGTARRVSHRTISNFKTIMKLYFFDTETTGTGDEAKIIQFAGKRPNEGIFCELFDPEQPIEIGAMATHHITEKMVKGKRKFKEIHSHLRGIFKDHVAVAHNAPFDVGRLEHEGLEKPKFVVDTLRVAKTIFQDYETPPEKYTLQYLRYFLGIEIDEAVAHDAKGDVLVLEELFFILYEKVRGKLFDGLRIKPTHGDKEVLTEMINISKKPVRLKVFPFGKHQGKNFSDVPVDYLQWAKEKMTDSGEDLIFTIQEELKTRHI